MIRMRIKLFIENAVRTGNIKVVFLILYAIYSFSNILIFYIFKEQLNNLNFDVSILYYFFMFTAIIFSYLHGKELIANHIKRMDK